MQGQSARPHLGTDRQMNTMELQTLSRQPDKALNQDHHTDELRRPSSSFASSGHDSSWGFLALPGEVRNMIYEYALVDGNNPIRMQEVVGTVIRVFPHHPEYIHRDDIPATDYSEPSAETSYAPYLYRNAIDEELFTVALLQTCRQIDEEASPIFYGKNLFSFVADFDGPKFFRQFEARAWLIRRIATYVDLFVDQASYGSAWQLLRRATNLEALFISDIFWLTLSKGTPDAEDTQDAEDSQVAARSLFSIAQAWVEDLRKKTGNRLAILDVLKMPAVRPYSECVYLRSIWAFSTVGQQAFRAELLHCIKEAEEKQVE